MILIRTEIKPKAEWTRPYRYVLRQALHNPNEIATFVELMNEGDDGEPVACDEFVCGTYFRIDEEEKAVHKLCQLADNENLDILWNEAVVPLGIRYIWHVEHKWGEDTHEFRTPDEVIAFKRHQINEFYEEDYEEHRKIKSLLSLGHVNEAFELARHHAAEQEYSRFGYYNDHSEIKTMTLVDLPDWILNAIIENYEIK